MTLTILLAMLGLVMLYYGGVFLVRGSSGLALRFGLSPLAVGLTVVAFGTSVPELLVSLDAAISGADGISVGNVIGSNIANIALILGVAALISPMVVQSKVIAVDVPIMIFASVLLIVVLMGGYVSRAEGAILALALVVYVWMTLRMAKASEGEAMMQNNKNSELPGARKMAVRIIIGLAVLFVGAHVLVISAVKLATMLHVSQAAIGLTVVAVGTSLPELATTIVASLKRHGDLALGNVLGSNCFNIFGVLGLTATIHPLQSGAISWVDLGLMAGLAVFLGAILFRRRLLNRAQGVFLVSVFVAYTIWTLAA
ncbi:MAG TPA: calcium/sodium antiporter [Xanthomonadales bacterium]|nr:calcium/sodium antiporter [Xanthomonadales bacterium]